MNKYYLLITVVACINLFLISCEKEVEPKTIKLNTNEKAVVVSSNNFAFELFKEINHQESSENIFISPLSIGMALAMTYNGADGETKEEIGNVLGFSNFDDNDLNIAYKGVYEALTGANENVEISLANSIWYTDAYSVENSFSNIIQTYYDGVINPIDLSDPEKAKETINEWVEDKTKNKIKNLIKQISADDVMFLVNAIYFNADWTYKFDKKETAEHDFYKEDGSTVVCQMMKVDEIDIRCRSANNFILIELPYDNNQFAMVIILPNENLKIEDIIEDITVNEINYLLEDTSKKATAIHMPKFKLEYQNRLNDILIEMGIVKAFDFYSAQFPELFKEVKDGLCIGYVDHKAFIEVDEEGTEAAAATVVAMIELSAGGDDSIWLNRPFIFLIRENSTGTILFMGKLTDPS